MIRESPSSHATQECIGVRSSKAFVSIFVCVLYLAGCDQIASRIKFDDSTAQKSGELSGSDRSPVANGVEVGRADPGVDQLTVSQPSTGLRPAEPAAPKESRGTAIAREVGGGNPTRMIDGGTVRLEGTFSSIELNGERASIKAGGITND